MASVATDSHANVYVEGQTESSDFPVKPATNVIGATPAYTNVMFVAKFSAVGALQFGTTIGFDPAVLQQEFGSLYSPVSGNLIAVDSDEDVYISGGVGPGFLVTPGAFQTTYTGPTPSCGSCTMGFVAKLKPDGSAFVFASYLGGSSGDQVLGLALDSSRNIYVTGDTYSDDFPVTSGAFQTAFPSSATTFVTKLNSSGSGLIYSTFLGGIPGGYGAAYATGIAVDNAGEAVVTGTTTNSSFRLMNPLQTSIPSNFDGDASYIAKFNAAGTALLFSTFFSGSIGANAAGIALSTANPNDVYIAGTAFDENLPTTPGAFQTSFPPPPANTEAQHIFVTKFDLGVPSPAICTNFTSVSLASPFNQSFPVPVTITNCGNGPLTVSNVSITSGSGFTQTNNCQSSAVAPGQSCTINLVFQESTPGTYNGTMTVSNNSPIQPLVIPLLGESTTPVVAVTNPFQVDDQLVGTTGATVPLYVYNQGNSLLSITTVNETGADFTASKRYCLEVQVNGACYILITFHPTAAGLRTATLTLIDNAVDSPQTVTVQGNGLATYPVPTISSISTSTVLQNVATQIYVYGGSFFPASQIVVRGTALATTYNGETSLSATIPASLVQHLGEIALQVVNPAPGGGASTAAPLLVYQDLPIGANSLIYEPYTRKIYASIASNATANANSILSIDPETQALGAPITVGSNPNHMSLTADGSNLYVGLDGASAIQQLKLPSGALGSSTSLASIAPGQPANAYDIAVVPGKEQIYVASLQLPYTDPSEGGSALASNGKLLSSLPGFGEGYPVDSICFLTDPTTFYGSNGQYGPQLYKFRISSYTSISKTVNSSASAGLSSAFICDSKYIYDLNGHVFDPVANQLIGTYPFPSAVDSVVLDPSVGRTYVLTYGLSSFLAFDQKTYTQVGTVPVPNNDQLTSLLRWGTDGFAYLAYNFSTNTSDLILMRSSIAQPSVGPNPVPTVAHSTPTVHAGNGNYQLTVTGTNFVPGAVVEWNGAIRTTIYQNSTTLIADIPAADVAAAGTAQITVVNPPFTGAASNQHAYTILPAQ